MYKRCPHYNSIISKADLEKELSTNYSGEDDLVLSLMSQKIQDGTIQTRHELGIANEELWSLNDWPEGEGFGSSDRWEYFRRIDETVAHSRAYLQAEEELASINGLTDAPRYEAVREYMNINQKIKEGMVEYV